MRLGQNRRMRGRNRNSKGPNPLTRSYESNGPDVKIRGTAQHIAEKYAQLARDAQASGDPIAAENYLQHAEHYNRIIAASQEQIRQQYGQYQRFPDDEQEEGESEEAGGNGFSYEVPAEQPPSEEMDYAFQPQPPYESPGASEGRQPRPQRRSRYGRIDRSGSYNNDQPRGNGEAHADDQGSVRRRNRFGRQPPQEQQPVIEPPQPFIQEEQPAPAPQRRSRVRSQAATEDEGAPTGLPAFLTTPVRTTPARAEPTENLFGDTVASEETPKPVRRRRRVATEPDTGNSEA